MIFLYVMTSLMLLSFILMIYILVYQEGLLKGIRLARQVIEERIRELEEEEQKNES